MSLSKLSVSLLVVVLFFLSSCRKEKNFPDTPQLTVREFSRINQNTVIWRIGFTDGDGDFGVLNEEDADNFINTIYKIENGRSIEVDATDYRIPAIEDVPTDNGVEGEFKIRIENLELLTIDGIDSLYFRAYALDRANHRSNTIQSPRIAIN